MCYLLISLERCASSVLDICAELFFIFYLCILLQDILCDFLITFSDTNDSCIYSFPYFLNSNCFTLIIGCFSFERDECYYGVYDGMLLTLCVVNFPYYPTDGTSNCAIKKQLVAVAVIVKPVMAGQGVSSHYIFILNIRIN